MNKIFLTVALVGLFGMTSSYASAQATTPVDNLMCKYNSAKFLPALKASVVSFLTSNIKFAWDPASIKISCAKQAESFIDERTCAVIFQAKDKTVFFLRDRAQCFTDQWGHSHCSDTSNWTLSNISLLKQQKTDEEGNFTGPVTCKATIYGAEIVNKKTSVILPTNKDFPEVSYQQ